MDTEALQREMTEMLTALEQEPPTKEEILKGVQESDDLAGFRLSMIIGLESKQSLQERINYLLDPTNAENQNAVIRQYFSGFDLATATKDRDFIEACADPENSESFSEWFSYRESGVTAFPERGNILNSFIGLELSDVQHALSELDEVLVAMKARISALS